MMTSTLRDRARLLPRRPGVYLWKDRQGAALYVGKAKDLRARVRQYGDGARLGPGKRALVHRAADVETIVTRNEAEALVLEASLIQQHTPPYNVRLADDSSYLYVKIARDTTPRVELTRKILADGAWYRGPYPNAGAIRRTLREARKLFPWCENPPRQQTESRRQQGPCFAYHLGLCPGICVGTVTIEEYQQSINGLKRFLDGDTRAALAHLHSRMATASRAERYEHAARIRDAIRAIERATTPQHVVTPRRESVDALGLAHAGTHAVVAVLSVRGGRVVDVRTFPLIVPSDAPPQEILRGFLLSYLPKTTDGAGTLLLPEAVTDAEILRPPTLAVARRGWKRLLLELARTNAEEALAKTHAELQSPAALDAALRDLGTVLHVPGLLHRIEAYDISNIQGAFPTGSMVIFVDGKPKRSAYRKFKIVTKDTPDDVAMMKEVLRRRFSTHATGRRQQGADSRDDWPLPDLILLDGGKAQLNAGRAVLRELGHRIPLAALAKRAEELFLPGRNESVVLSRTSPALFLLQRLRDEAHRFTLGYHQLLRGKRMTRSILEEIPGVGDATRKKLLRAFGSLRAIRAAPEAELARVVGAKRARTIRPWLADASETTTKSSTSRSTVPNGGWNAVPRRNAAGCG